MFLSFQTRLRQRICFNSLGVGKTAEVSISPRRNVLRKQFGFSRFVEVLDGRLLAVHLNNIIILGKKIHVNLPRYERGVVKSNSGVSVVASGLFKGDSRGVHLNTKGFTWRGSKSYAEVLGGVGSKQQGSGGNSVNFCSITNEYQQLRMKKAYVGKITIRDAAYNIHIHMEMEGIYAVKISPLGGNLCLL